MAEKLLYEVTQNDYERAAVYEREKILRDYYAGLAYAEDQGLKRGIEQGIEQGIERGKGEGINQRNLEIASLMKLQGYTAEVISGITGLTEKEIEEA